MKWNKWQAICIPIVFEAFKAVDIQDTNLYLGINILTNWLINILDKPENSFKTELLRSMPLQLSRFWKIPPQRLKSGQCRYNLPLVWNKPLIYIIYLHFACIGHKCSYIQPSHLSLIAVIAHPTAVIASAPLMCMLSTCRCVFHPVFILGPFKHSQLAAPQTARVRPDSV